jgi:hypothetical protein
MAAANSCSIKKLQLINLCGNRLTFNNSRERSHIENKNTFYIKGKLKLSQMNRNRNKKMVIERET